MNPQEIVEEIPQRLRALREARQVSYRMMGMSRGTIWKIECKHQMPSLRMLERYAEWLEIGLEVLLRTDERFYSTLFLEDPFVQAVVPFLTRLNEEQRQYILKVLEAAPKLPEDRRKRRGFDPSVSLILQTYRESIGSKGSNTSSQT